MNQDNGSIKCEWHGHCMQMLPHPCFAVEQFLQAIYLVQSRQGAASMVITPDEANNQSSPHQICTYYDNSSDDEASAPCKEGIPETGEEAPDCNVEEAPGHVISWYLCVVYTVNVFKLKFVLLFWTDYNVLISIVFNQHYCCHNYYSLVKLAQPLIHKTTQAKIVTACETHRDIILKSKEAWAEAKHSKELCKAIAKALRVSNTDSESDNESNDSSDED
ncbi:hypothetical protein EDB19DRAFT_1833504 [Suillus lakei]|nr:hypothetical protein EDB19DRAFT_1833504 [Suillus lakei]